MIQEFDTGNAHGIFNIVMWPLEVEVCEAHIRNSFPTSVVKGHCPIANALKDHSLAMSDIKLSPEEKIKVFKFMDDYDAKRPVEPFSFIAEAA